MGMDTSKTDDCKKVDVLADIENESDEINKVEKVKPKEGF